jgi:hypothetical protein
MKRLIVAVAVALSAASMSAQTNSEVGTWKLNPAKSKYDPGPVPQSNVIVITVAGTGITVSAKGTDGEGKPTSSDYTVSYDGKDAPVKGQPAYDMTSARRIDKNTTELTRKKAGKVVQTARRAISADGKTMTIITTGTDEKGRKIHNVAVFEKQ